jgi:predicted ATP-grasp superfamily ATP-dependent carboligase
MAREREGHAFVLGDRDLVAPLDRAGVHVTVVSRRTAPARYSRYTSAWLEDPRPSQRALSEALLERARTISGPVVLFYQQDDDLLFVSRHRAELATGLRFIVPDVDLVERLVDKAAFQELAAHHGLPVPPAWRLDSSEVAPDLDVSLPVVVKPLRRDVGWSSISSGKAVLVGRQEELHCLLATLATRRVPVLVQQLVAGPETAIESYHVYVDAAGDVAAEFTGRKVRTHPRVMGHSTALVTTDAPDVLDLGRATTRTLGLRGVAKLDFKRDPTGKLWLLEVNPRFTLWHHVGAAAGVNIPAMVWADLVGEPRPPAGRPGPGVRWCRVERDLLAAREEGIGLVAWLRWVAACETRAGLDPMDPVPLIASRILVPAGEALGRRFGRHG